MLKSTDIRILLDDLASLPGLDIAASEVVVMRSDLADFTKDQRSDRPYLLGIVPSTQISGRGDDGFSSTDHFELFVAHRAVSKQTYAKRLEQLDQCADIVRRIVSHIQDCISTFRAPWVGVQLSGSPIEPIEIDQMRGYILILDLRQPV